MVVQGPVIKKPTPAPKKATFIPTTRTPALGPAHKSFNP